MRKLLYFKEINPVIRIMIFSDIMTVMSRLGLVAPVFAVFITNRIPGANLEIVGIATTIYMLTKSLMQIPFSALFDKIKGESDDYLAVFWGTMIMSLVPLIYIFVNSVPQLFAAQFVLGLSAAAMFPSWTAIFTRHVDHDHEGIEWGTYFTLTDFSSAIGAALGGFIAYRFGYDALFITASAVSLFGALNLLNIKSNLCAKK